MEYDYSDAGDSHLLVRWVFLRLLGVVFLFAFISVFLEVEGLIGNTGVLPLGDFLHAARSSLGEGAYRRLPTFFWLNHSDQFLKLSSIVGIILSAMLFIGMAPAILALLLWLIYLSFVVAGQEFFHYQWDVLLLEVGFLTIFFAPLKIKARLSSEKQPSVVVLWLLRLLLVKLMVLSGYAKLASGDESWRDLSALLFHYETQPLPTAMGWFFHQMPALAHKSCTVFMFAAELFVPVLVFAGRSARSFAFIALAGLQLIIMLTGNYCFFNLLTIALCVLLLNDSDLLRVFPGKLVRVLQRSRVNLDGGEARIGFAGILFGAVIVILNVFVLSHKFALSSPVSEKVVRTIAPLRSINTYGLFAVMTKQRDEIIVEGSNDGKEWLAFEFKWKPGSLVRMPAWVAPLQPRVDWQMWFAALSRCEHETWFLKFMYRLLSGSQAVTELIEKNPFPAQPPQFIRARRFRYEFSEFPVMWSGAGWWSRKEIGPYCPPLSLKELSAKS